MDIEQFAYNVIDKLKALPPVASQTGSESDLETLWDEFKEQIQYEEYDSFNHYEEMIEAMIRDMIDLEDDYDVEILHYFFKNERFKEAEPLEKRKYIIESVFDQIKEIAGVEEIAYKNDISYVQYRSDYSIDDRFLIVAEVLQKVGPSEYLVHAYSSATGPGGEQGIENFSTLEQECELEVIDFQKFHLMRQCFHPTLSGETRKDLAKLNRECYLDKLAPLTTARTKALRAKRMAQKEQEAQEAQKKELLDKRQTEATVENATAKEMEMKLQVTRPSSVSITTAGKVAVFVREPFLSAVKSPTTGKWSWGYASSDDLKDNFKPISPDDSRFNLFINEARSALAGTACPKMLRAI